MDARIQAYLVLAVIFVVLLVSLYLASIAMIVLGSVILVAWTFHYVFVTRVLWPTGESTPGDKPLSYIEAMEARGEYAKAAAAYRQELVDDPADFRSCERLALLARAHLKDHDLALYAFREAERRVTGPRRKAGYAMLALGVLRDDLQDPGRAMVEIRRILATYPDLPNAADLSAEAQRLKTTLFEGT